MLWWWDGGLLFQVGLMVALPCLDLLFQVGLNALVESVMLATRCVPEADSFLSLDTPTLTSASSVPERKLPRLVKGASPRKGTPRQGSIPS